jgi:hypothetical protein
MPLTNNPSSSSGSGACCTLEQSRQAGDTFLGDVYWDNQSKAIFGKASGEADQDYLRIYSDKVGHLQVIDSTKDGAGTIRAISVQMGGAEVARVSPAGVVLVNATVPVGAEKLRVNGDVYIDGKLTVIGAIDPPSVSLSGGTALFFDSADGSTAPVSAAGHARIRYVNPTGWQQSINGGAYSAFGGGGGPGSDTTAWHNAGDNYAADSIIGNLNAGPNKLSVYNNNQKWIEFSQDSVGGTNAPRKNILIGTEYTPGSVDGGQLQYKRTDTWALFNIISTQDGSAGQGTGESLIGLQNNAGQQVVINMIGSAFAGMTYGVPTANQARMRSSSDNFVIGQINKQDLIFFTNNIPFVKFDKDQHVRTTGPVYIGTYSDVTPNIANEFLRVKGGVVHFDQFLGIGADLSVDPTFTLQMRRDAADINTGIVIDNRNAAGQPFFTMGNDPRGSNAALAFSYDNATDNTLIQNTQITGCTCTIGNVGNNPFVIKTNNVTAVTVAGSGAVTMASSLSVATTAVVGGTTYVSNEKLHVIGIAHIDTFLGIGANLTVDPTFTIQIRRDVADINTGIVIDNRDAAGQPFFTMGNDPRGTNHSVNILFDNATNNAKMTHSELAAATFTIGTVGNNPLVIMTNNATSVTVAADGGVVVGAATGGSKGGGTINVSGDIYKNGTAYTNPDYVLEMWATGRISRFAGNPGASQYVGRMDLEELEAYCRSHLRLPGIDDQPMGGFARMDFIMEKLEEAFTHLFDLKRKLEAAISKV